MHKEWKFLKHTELIEKSAPSNDFVIEMQNVLDIVKGRVNVSINNDKERMNKILNDLYNSSDIASLFRNAHRSGFHITFEQGKTEWELDPEYYDPNVFKTDKYEAAAYREDRELLSYKRYFDPLMTKRDKILKDINNNKVEL